MKYTVNSYARESLPFLGHIKFTRDTDTEEEARRVAKEIHERGNDIQIHVMKGKELVFSYAEVTQ